MVSKASKLKLILCIVLTLAAFCAGSGAAQDFASVPMDVSRYQELKGSDRPIVELMLIAMFDTVFYVNESVGHTAICATPATPPGERLVKLVDSELAAPSDPGRTEYAANERLARVFVNALKKEGVCK
jgi:hypothetical protein